MKVKREYYGTARDGQSQKFNAYPIRSDGRIIKYMTRFYTDNYVCKNGIAFKTQWCGKGCGHKTEADAVAFGYKICSGVKEAGDFTSIKEVVELNAAYNKAFK
jgi:hypothetical protein